MMDDDRPAVPLHHQRAGAAARSNGRSPAKSSSTSEEEGQVEERETIVEKRFAISPARHASPREQFAQESNAMTRERSAPVSWRQRTPVHSDRANNHSWRQDASEPLYGRGRGVEGFDTEAGPSRRAMYRIEERGPHADAYGRHRDNLQPHDRYDAATTRSMSIGAFDERYQSPSASQYDDRGRDWREGRARERDYQWDRARDPVYHRSQYARPSSPIRPSPTPHSRGLSGSWSGPASPSSSWRDRWASKSGAAPAAWDRERLERDRDRGGYWQSREGPEVGADVYQRKLSNPRSPPPPPFREARDHSRTRVAKAGHNQVLKSNSSPTPSAVRSPDLQRNNSYEVRRESDPATARQWPEDEAARPLVEAAKTPPRPSSYASSAAHLEQPIKESEQEVDMTEKEAAQDTIKLEPVEEVVLEAVSAATEPLGTTVTATDVPHEAGIEAHAVIENPTAAAMSHSSPMEVAVEEARAREDVAELDKTSEVPVTLAEEGQSQVAAVENDVEAASKFDREVELAKAEREPDAGVVSLAEPVQSEIEVLPDADMNATLPQKESEANRTTDDVDMEPDEQYDASVDVTIDSVVGVGDDSDQIHTSRLRLDQEKLRDFTDEPPLPTPRTREEQDRVKRAGMFRLLQCQRPNVHEIKRVFAENKKTLANPLMRPLESAIHGEYPRKNHTEPWLDEDDEEIQQMRLKMTRILRARQKRLNDKIASLRSRYRQLNKDWQRHCAQLYRQSEARESQNSRTLFGGTVTISGTSASLISQGSGLGQGQAGGANSGGLSEESTGSLMMGPSMTRANRRQTQTGFAGFGDAVRSEAEFLEILASLENADMQDPNMRAARTTATEPDMILNPDSKAALLDDYDDDNGFVADPLAFYFPTFDPDHWTEDEKTTFDRRYALFPKQFGKIAASLPHKTAKQCVAYYYLTKHAGHDYKSLTAARNRDRKRKTRVKPKKGRGSALMADLKGDDVEEEEQQSPLEGSMAESTSLISARARPAGASSRARILTSSTLSGDLGVVTEEGEEETFDQNSGRKRRVEEVDVDEKKSRPGNKPKRAKSEKKSRASITGASVEEVPSNLTYGDPDLAAAEALGALAGAASAEAATSGDTSLSRRKKSTKVTLSGNSPARIEGIDDGAKRSRQTTSSYWSVAERNEFLRSLATWGKDWDAIATTLSTKSAAQARNYYARNVEESEFVEAVAMARDNASLDLDKRQDLATAFIMRRASLAVDKSQPAGAPHSGYFASRVTPTPDGNTPTARGLNINSLLNDDVSSAQVSGRRASLTEWFGNKKDRDDDSNDETEDEDQEQAMEADAEQRREREPSDYFDGRGRSSHYQYASAVPPSRHLLTNQMQRRSPSILSSMPPPSAFIGTGRYSLPGQPQRIPSGGQEGQRSPLASFHYNDSMARTSTHSPSEGHPSTQQYRQDRLNSFDRDATRSSWSPTVPSPGEPMPVPHRHGSWPHAYTPSHLAPPQLNREDRSPSSLSPYPRPNTTHGTSSLSAYPFPHPTYERPHSSSGHTSAIRSLSPNPNPPTPRLPPLNQSLFTQRRDQRDSPH